MTTTTQKTRKASGNRTQTKERILSSARAIAVELGAEHLTIDAVAKHAGVSKGGVLYHFHSKKELMSALINSYVNHLDQRLKDGMSQFPLAQDPLVQGFAAWFERFYRDDGGSKAWGSSLFAVHSYDPSLLKPMEKWYSELFEKIRQSPLGLEKTATAVLALEGLFLLQMYDIDFLTEEEHDRVLKHIVTSCTEETKTTDN